MYKIICDLTEDGLLVGTFTETTKSYREALDIVKYLRQFAGYEGFEDYRLRRMGVLTMAILDGLITVEQPIKSILEAMDDLPADLFE